MQTYVMSKHYKAVGGSCNYGFFYQHLLECQPPFRGINPPRSANKYVADERSAVNAGMQEDRKTNRDYEADEQEKGKQGQRELYEQTTVNDFFAICI